MPQLSKQKALPFNPPRPATKVDMGSGSLSKSKHRKPATPASSRKRAKTQLSPVSRTPSPTPMTDPPRPQSASPERDRSSRDLSVDSLSTDPDFILAEITVPKDDRKDELQLSEPDFPPRLLAAIIHRRMTQKGEKTRITKDANRLYAKYIDLFVKEAVARAIYERREALNADGTKKDRTRILLDSYLEVEDLEKLAPQLLLDF